MRTETIVGLFILGAICILLYLSLSIGSFRFDRDRFHFYKAYFEDTGGLEGKDPVKIAGVDVGWVSEIKLPSDGGKALVIFRVKKDHKLAKNAYGMVRQEGFFGPKYLELDPGDSSTGILPPGSALGAPAQTPASWGELITKFSDVATHFKSVAASLQNVIATREGEENLKLALSGFARASDRIADFSEVLERTLKHNEDQINNTLSDIREFATSLKNKTPDLLDDTRDVVRSLRDDVLPTVSRDADRLTNALVDDAIPHFDSLSDSAGGAFKSLEGTSNQARGSFREAEGVLEKINSGKGFIGKLVNDDDTYNDLKKTVSVFRDYTTKMQALDFMVDMHSEMMLRDWNSKGYFELKIRPTSDYFYTLQLVSDQKGIINRDQIHYKRLNKAGQQIPPPRPQDLYRYPDTKDVTTRHKNAILIGFQFGKRFDRLAFRVGLFENTFGVGADYYVPINTDKLHWITTLEAFDMKGVQRLHDTRPHFKWLNKLYFMKNIYTTFGVDDFYSKHNQNFFVGGGIRFGDKDLKYLLPNVPVAALRP